jgi:hypothetical protein
MTASTSLRFMLALTPCARLQPVQHLLSVTDGGLEGAAEDGENEGVEAEAVLQRFYQRWEQSGAAWSIGCSSGGTRRRRRPSSVSPSPSRPTASSSLLLAPTRARRSPWGCRSPEALFDFPVQPCGAAGHAER